MRMECRKLSAVEPKRLGQTKMPRLSCSNNVTHYTLRHMVAVVKIVLCSMGAHLTKPSWNKPHTHSNPTNLALFRHKITVYRFSQGAHTIAGGSNGRRGAEPPSPRHINQCMVDTELCN